MRQPFRFIIIIRSSGLELYYSIYYIEYCTRQFTILKHYIICLYRDFIFLGEFVENYELPKCNLWYIHELTRTYFRKYFRIVSQPISLQCCSLGSRNVYELTVDKTKKKLNVLNKILNKTPPRIDFRFSYFWIHIFVSICNVYTSLKYTSALGPWSFDPHSSYMT